VRTAPGSGPAPSPFSGAVAGTVRQVVIDPQSDAFDGLVVVFAAYAGAAIVVVLMMRWLLGACWRRWRDGRWPALGWYPVTLLSGFSAVLAGLSAWAYGWSEPGVAWLVLAVLVAWSPALRWARRRGAGIV
jgi:hypothetical protein